MTAFRIKNKTTPFALTVSQPHFIAKGSLISVIQFDIQIACLRVQRSDRALHKGQRIPIHKQVFDLHILTMNELQTRPGMIKPEVRSLKIKRHTFETFPHDVCRILPLT